MVLRTHRRKLKSPTEKLHKQRFKLRYVLLSIYQDYEDKRYLSGLEDKEGMYYSDLFRNVLGGKLGDEVKLILWVSVHGQRSM